MKEYEIYCICLGRALRHLRRRFEVEQWEIADKVGLSQSGISRLEGGGKVSVETLYRYSVYIERDISFVVGLASKIMKEVLDIIEAKKDMPKQAIISFADKALKESSGSIRDESPEDDPEEDWD
jgi:transcriptional regulator with XRE-family HTH domain